MKKIIIAAWAIPHFKEMSLTAAALCKDFTIVMLCPENLRNNKTIDSFYAKHLVEIRYIDDQLLIEYLAGLYPENLFSKLFSRVFLQYSLLSFPFHLFKFFKRKYFARLVIEQLQPDLIILPRIGVSEFEDYLNRSAQEKIPNIPIVHIPYAWITTHERLVARSNNSIFSANFSSKTILSLFKRKWEMKNLNYFPTIKTLALELSGTSVSNPWNSENSANYIFLESEKMAESFILDGGESKKIKITGSLSQDVIYNFQKAPSKIESPFILFAVPPDQTSNKPLEFEFDSYQELICKWIEALKQQTKYEVILSIHPREKKIKELIQTKYNLSIYEGDIYEIFPHCALFVSTSSGLMRSAALLNIQTINYDCFHYRLFECKDAKNIHYALCFQEFQLKLSSVLNDPHTDASPEINNEWGILDGGAGGRIKKEIYKLIT